MGKYIKWDGKVEVEVWEWILGYIVFDIFFKWYLFLMVLIINGNGLLKWFRR